MLFVACCPVEASIGIPLDDRKLMNLSLAYELISLTLYAHYITLPLHSLNLNRHICMKCKLTIRAISVPRRIYIFIMSVNATMIVAIGRSNLRLLQL